MQPLCQRAKALQPLDLTVLPTRRRDAAGEYRQRAGFLASTLRLARALPVALAGLALGACGPSDGAGTGTNAGGDQAPADMHEMMTWVLDPAADAIWGAAGFVITAEGETSLAPTTDEGWAQVRHGAAVIVAGGDLLLLPAYLPAENADAWMEFARGMKRIGGQAAAAVEAKDADALFTIGGHLYNVCLACHQVYAREEAEDG